MPRRRAASAEPAHCGSKTAEPGANSTGLLLGRLSGVAVVDLAGITVARIADEPQDPAGFRCGDPEVDRWLRDDAVVVDRLSGFRLMAATDGTRVVGRNLLNALEVEARWTAGGVVAASAATAADVEQSIAAVLPSRVVVAMGWQGTGLVTALVWDALHVVVAASTPLGVRFLVAPDHLDTPEASAAGWVQAVAGAAGLVVPAPARRRRSVHPWSGP
jgi:hypothetical protein